jgi:hypothetical protein
VCSVYGLLHPDALVLLRLQSARASDAHVNRIGGRKAFINVDQRLALRSLMCHPWDIQKRNGIIHPALQKILAALPRP